MLAKNSNSTKRRENEYTKLKDFLIKNDRLKYRLDGKILAKYLMFRSIKTDGTYISVDTLLTIKTKLTEITKKLGYDDTLMSSEEINNIISGYKIKIKELKMVKSHTPPVKLESVTKAINLYKKRAMENDIVAAKLLTLVIGIF